MDLETARENLRLDEYFTRETLKINRDRLIKNSKITITNIEKQLEFDHSEERKNKLNEQIVEEEKKIENIKEAYRVLKQFHRTTHSSTTHNRFTNARKGASSLFGRMRKGISGIASRMYTRRNGNASHNSGSRRSSRSRPSASGREETKGNNDNESPYTKSRRESGAPYGTNWSRSRYFNGSRQRFSSQQGFTGTRQVFRTSDDEQIDKYLKVLGLPLKIESFTQDEIKKAFRTRSLQTHPNKNPIGHSEFQEVNEANTQLKILLNDKHNYTPPEHTGFMPSASPMHSTRTASPKASRTSSPKRPTSPKASRTSSPKRHASPKVGVQEKESHIMKLKKALGVLGLDPNTRHSSGKILETYLANTDPSPDIDIAFTILYFNPKPEFGPPRTRDMVEAKIEERKNILKKYKENI